MDNQSLDDLVKYAIRHAWILRHLAERKVWRTTGQCQIVRAGSRTKHKKPGFDIGDEALDVAEVEDDVDPTSIWNARLVDIMRQDREGLGWFF